jgi:hypothetical protein
MLADQAPEAVGGLLGVALDHCQATRDVVRVAVAHVVVEIAVLVTAAAALMAAAVQPLDDVAKGQIDALDAFAVELAPDAILQFLQLAVGLSNERLSRAAGRVVSGTGRHECSTGIVELLPVRSVVLGLRLDALGLALQVVQQARVTAGIPSAVPLLAASTVF